MLSLQNTKQQEKKIVYQVLRQNLPLLPDGLTMVSLHLQTIEEFLLILVNTSPPIPYSAKVVERKWKYREKVTHHPLGCPSSGENMM